MFITTFIKGEALRLLRTNSSKENFQNRLEEFQKHLRERGYPRNLITLTLSEIHFENRKEALRQKPSREKTILPFVTQYQPSVPSLKNILMKHWQLIEKQPLLRQIYKEPPIISCKRGRSLKDILVKAKLWDLKAKTRGWKAWVRLVNPYDISSLESIHLYHSPRCHLPRAKFFHARLHVPLYSTILTRLKSRFRLKTCLLFFTLSTTLTIVATVLQAQSFPL